MWDIVGLGGSNSYAHVGLGAGDLAYLFVQMIRELCGGSGHWLGALFYCIWLLTNQTNDKLAIRSHQH